jgi:hypothetical protein
VAARGRFTVVLGEIGGQLLVGGVDLLPPRPRVAAFTAGEVGGEVFAVDLVSRPVGGDLLQGQTAVLDDQDSLVAVGGKCCLDGAVWFVWGTGQNQQPLRGLAHFHATGAFTAAGKVACAELTALAQIVFYLAEPAGGGDR